MSLGEPLPRVLDPVPGRGGVAGVVVGEAAPVEAKLRQIAVAMATDPSDRATIDQWARRMAVAPRTLTRALQRETGMSFGRWRQQLHILIALQRLGQGASVQTVALELGYEGASAFVTMFRKALGKPPARYLAERRSAA